MAILVRCIKLRKRPIIDHQQDLGGTIGKQPTSLDHRMFDTAWAGRQRAAAGMIAAGDGEQTAGGIMYRQSEVGRRKRQPLCQIGEKIHRPRSFAMTGTKDRRHIAAIAKTSVGDFESHPIEKSGAPAQHRCHLANCRLTLALNEPLAGGPLEPSLRGFDARGPGGEGGN
jgi:hypothetical protein